MKSPMLLAVALSLSVGVALAQPAGRCTRETLSVQGTPVSVSYCVEQSGRAAAGHDLPVAVSETYSTPRSTFSQASTLQFIAGEDASRVIEDLALDRLGLQGTLHLTLVLRNGLVRIDSAMLTPGAITIK